MATLVVGDYSSEAEINMEEDDEHSRKCVIYVNLTIHRLCKKVIYTK